ncbi:MAG: nucleoside deaminase [Clostridia bacterium]|nr:nucleoside deaminase [Clostridia bacterium]
MPEERFMKRALELAAASGAESDVPVGCVIVRGGEIIAEGRNTREKEQNAIRHAETSAIDAACRALGTRRLFGCELYVTPEPCLMCAGAIMNAGIDTVVFGAKESRTGALGGVLNVFEEGFGFKPRVYGGFMEKECAEILSEFFKNIR